MKCNYKDCEKEADKNGNSLTVTLENGKKEELFYCKTHSRMLPDKFINDEY